MIPQPVIRRLPKYLWHVQLLRELGVEWASSGQIADALALTSSTVRQDLTHLKLNGVAKRGYCTESLEQVLLEALGCKRKHRVVIVGAGHLGQALAQHGEFGSNGFEICGVFDRDLDRVGETVGEHIVQPMSRINQIIKDQGVEIGIIAVPGPAAQSVADYLILCGVSALLNLAYTHLQVPPGNAVVDVRIRESLQELACILNNKNK